MSWQRTCQAAGFLATNLIDIVRACQTGVSMKLPCRRYVSHLWHPASVNILVLCPLSLYDCGLWKEDCYEQQSYLSAGTFWVPHSY